MPWAELARPCAEAPQEVHARGGGSRGQWDFLPLLAWLFHQLIWWHLMPKDVDHGCTLSWREGKDAARCSAAWPSLHHPRSHLEVSETHGEVPPTMGYGMLHVQVPPLERRLGDGGA